MALWIWFMSKTLYYSPVNKRFHRERALHLIHHHLVAVWDGYFTCIMTENNCMIFILSSLWGLEANCIMQSDEIVCWASFSRFYDQPKTMNNTIVCVQKSFRQIKLMRFGLNLLQSFQAIYCLRKRIQFLLLFAFN